MLCLVKENRITVFILYETSPEFPEDSTFIKMDFRAVVSSVWRVKSGGLTEDGWEGRFEQTEELGD